jgi:uncharacterized membrane protein YfcA
MHVLIAGLIGLLGGVTSGLFGVGGGIVMVPAMLLLLSPPIRDIKQAVGTSLAVIIPTAAVGSLRHHQFQNVHWPTVLILAPMALVGTWGGHLVDHSGHGGPAEACLWRVTGRGWVMVACGQGAGRLDSQRLG